MAAPLPFAQALPSVLVAADRLMLRGAEDKQGPSGLREEPASVWTDRRAFTGTLGLGAEGLAVLCQLRTW